MKGKSVLVLEKPEISEVPIHDEADGLLSGINEELADYLTSNIGYNVLSRRLAEEKKARDQKKAAATQENSLPKALRKADISIYSKESVGMYKKSMVRRGWIKFILNTDKFHLWINLFFFTPAVVAVMYLLGWINGWQSITLAVISQLPCARSLWREMPSCKDGEFFFCMLLFTMPLVGLVLAVLNYGKVWTAVTFLVSFLGVSCFFKEFLEQLRNSKIFWSRIPIERYGKEIPMFVLLKVKQIHELCPTARFTIEELQLDIHMPDPFLIVTDLVTGKDFYIDVWEEPRFEEKFT